MADKDFIIRHKGDPDHELSPHFDTSEFRCKCGCGELRLHHDVPAALESLRAFIFKMTGKDTPLIISSGYRCESHNKKIGGVKSSDHTRGIAVDILTPAGMLTRIFAVAAWQVRNELVPLKRPCPRRVGCYDGYQGKHGFIHVTIFPRWPYPSRWGDWDKR